MRTYTNYRIDGQLGKKVVQAAKQYRKWGWSTAYIISALRREFRISYKEGAWAVRQV